MKNPGVTFLQVLPFNSMTNEEKPKLLRKKFGGKIDTFLKNFDPGQGGQRSKNMNLATNRKVKAARIQIFLLSQ